MLLKCLRLVPRPLKSSSRIKSTRPAQPLNLSSYPVPKKSSPLEKSPQTCMHVTMLRLSLAYAIFTAPRIVAHIFGKGLSITPHKVGSRDVYILLPSWFYLFSVNDPLLMVLLDVRHQCHHLCGLFKWIQRSLQNICQRYCPWICNKSLIQKLLNWCTGIVIDMPLIKGIR